MSNEEISKEERKRLFQEAISGKIPNMIDNMRQGNQIIECLLLLGTTQFVDVTMDDLYTLKFHCKQLKKMHEDRIKEVGDLIQKFQERIEKCTRSHPVE